MAAGMQITALWVVTLCSLADHQSFRIASEVSHYMAQQPRRQSSSISIKCLTQTSLRMWRNPDHLYGTESKLMPQVHYAGHYSHSKASNV
jgi:hypothetical protein